MGGKAIKEFVGLRSKMYSILSEGDEQKNTAKGVSRNVSDNILTHQHYRDSLLKKTSMKNKMVRFVHDRHQLYTVEQNKTSLSPFNDKRYILEDGVSHSFGHYEIDILSEENQILLDQEFSEDLDNFDEGDFISLEEEVELDEVGLVDLLADLIGEGDMYV